MACPRSCRKSLWGKTSNPVFLNHDFNISAPALAWLRLGPCAEGKSGKNSQKHKTHQTPWSHSIVRNGSSNSSFSLMLWPFVFPQLSVTLKSLSHPVYLVIEWTFRVTKPSYPLPLGFSFVFVCCLLDFPLFSFPLGGVGGQAREGPRRQAAKGVSSARLSNGFADMDSRNCCLFLPCQEQPIRRQVLKV